MKKTKNRALFLDRDGVINVYRTYVHRIEDFEFVEGIFDLCLLAQRLDFKIFVITNQAGIGRGYYSVEDFARLTEWMLGQLRARGIHIEKVYFCPYHPTAGIGKYRQDSFERKPNPGMILQAKKEFDLDLSKSILIGDKDSDLVAGRAAGVLWNLKFIQGEKSFENGKLKFSRLSGITEWLQGVFGDASK